MNKYLLSNNSYTTLPDSRDWLSKIVFNAPIYLFLRLTWNYYLLGRCAKRGLFNRDKQAFYSEKNLRILESCGARFNITGLENLSSEPGPFVLVGNHMSSIETATLNAIIAPRLKFTYVIKDTLFKVPFLGAAMSAINAIGVERSNARDDFKIILEEGQRRLSEGCSVLIFPESTRQDEFKAERFNSIGVKLAKAAGVKIIAFALKTDFMSPGKLSSEFGHMHTDRELHFEFAPPMTITGNGKEEHKKIVEFIASKSAEWNDAR